MSQFPTTINHSFRRQFLLAIALAFAVSAMIVMIGAAAGEPDQRWCSGRYGRDTIMSFAPGDENDPRGYLVITQDGVETKYSHESGQWTPVVGDFSLSELIEATAHDRQEGDIEVFIFQNMVFWPCSPGQKAN
jgi:hypothetical protein